MGSRIILFLLAAAICAAAFESFNAESELERRFPYTGGGWGLTSDPCPADTFVIDGGGGYQRCCPNGMEAPDVGLFCCVGNLNCGDSLQATPFCADSTWTLWNATGTYFCCLPGQIGTMGPDCVSGTTEVAATLSAESLGQPTPSGLAGGKLRPSGASATQSSSPTMTDVPTSPSTTGKGGNIGGVISSIISVATGHSKSDAVALSPIGGNLVSSSILRGCMVLVGCFGFGVIFLYA